MKNKLFLILTLATVMLLSGCNTEKEISYTDEGSSAKQTKNPAAIEVICNRNLDLDTYISFDWQMLEDCGYGDLFPQEFLYQEVKNFLMEVTPENTSENSAMKKAIHACESLVTECGYEDAQMTSYKITLADLWKAAWLVTPYETLKEHTNYDSRFVRQQEIQDAHDKGNIELASQLSEQKKSMESYVQQHTDNLDAYLFVYRTKVNGLTIDADAHELWCIYVPEHEKVLAMAAGAPLVVTNVETETKTMSVYRAIEEVVALLELQSSDDITVTEIEMIYTTPSDFEEYFTEPEIINPSWKICYYLNADTMDDTSGMEEKQVIYVDAVTGEKLS